MRSTATFSTEHSTTKGKCGPKHVPWSNRNEVRASHTTEEWTSGTRDYAHQLRTKLHKEGNDVEYPDTFGDRCLVSPSRCPDATSGTEALGSEVHHHDTFVERRPGVVRVSGIGDDEGYEEQEATVSTIEESTVNIIARVVDTEEENRRLRAQEQLLLERDQLLRERDQLHWITGNAVIVDHVVVTSRDVEDGSKEVTRGATNDRDLPENNRCKCGTRGRRLLAIGAILLAVIAIVVTLVIVLRPDPSELECTQMADGTCRMEDYPVKGFHADISCPASASSVSDCSTCVIISNFNSDQCTSCTVCSEIVAYDCSNIAEDDCVIMDCAENCESLTTPAPTTPMPTDQNATDSIPEIPCSDMADGSLTVARRITQERTFTLISAARALLLYF